MSQREKRRPKFFDEYELDLSKLTANRKRPAQKTEMEIINELEVKKTKQEVEKVEEHSQDQEVIHGHSGFKGEKGKK
jgi:hypothetical protein